MQFAAKQKQFTIDRRQGGDLNTIGNNDKEMDVEPCGERGQGRGFPLPSLTVVA